MTWTQTEALAALERHSDALTRCYARWMQSKGMFYKSPGWDFTKAVEAIQTEFDLVPKGQGMLEIPQNTNAP